MLQRPEALTRTSWRPVTTHDCCPPFGQLLAPRAGPVRGAGLMLTARRALAL